MKNNNIFSLLILIVIVVAAYFIVQTVRQGAQAAAEPFQQVNQANQALQTQMSSLLNPTPTIVFDPVTYINDVRALARLETIQYSIEQVVEINNGVEGGVYGYVFGDKILFVAHGTVIAGIDMQKLNPEDLRFENGVLTVRLPPTEIFVATLDNEKSRVYARDTGMLQKPDPTLETQVRQAAEQKILTAALESGILEQARLNAEAHLIKFFAALGYPNTIFVDDQG